MELFIQELTCAYTTSLDSDGEIASYRVLARPVFHEVCSVSCTMNACERLSPHLNLNAMEVLYEKVPYILQLEVPDNASANRRKKAATWRQLPANCFFVDNNCGAHSIHIISEHRHKRAIGDIQACFVTCNHYNHSQKLLCELKEIITDDIHRGNRHLTAPDPSIDAQNREIFEPMFLRRETVARDGDSISWLESSTTDFAEMVNIFLSKWNGRWEQDIVKH